MASPASSSSFLLCFIFFACFFPSNGDVSSEIYQACNATRNVEVCKASLSSAGSDLPNPTTPLDIILLAINVSAKNLRIAQSMAQTILQTAGGNLNLTLAGRNCLEVLSLSEYRIGLSAEGMPRGRTKDVRFWLGAAMHYQYDCWSALKNANTTQRVNETMAFMSDLMQLTSDALSMIFAYDLHGNESFRWGPPQTERDGFWESDSGSATGSFSGFGFPENLTADATVCSELETAGCGYRTIQEAVNAAPDGPCRDGWRFVIRIRAGIYNETVRVPIEKVGLVFLGEGMGKTVITGNLNVAQMVGVSTYNSATVGVAGDRFMARDITFENTAGPEAHQAVAFRSTSDLSLLENCEFLGHQDTLYVNTLRQFYKGCRIEGTVDFIFGDSASIFEDCLIFIRPRQLNPEAGSTNTITAHGRLDPAQPTGLVFKNCILNGTEEFLDFYKKKPKSYKNYLGRPWKEFSRTVFIDCIMEYIINPQGWAAWDGDFALSTLYYGEFASTGAGANVSTRVPWSSQIPVEHLGSYSIQNFIQGDEWLPSKI